MYDAATMHISSRSTAALLAVTAALCAPAAARAADAPAAPLITLTAARAVGTEAVTVSGTAPTGSTLDVSLYVRYSRDIPTVLVSRSAVATKDGRYQATLRTAPAYFRDAILTVVVRDPATGSDARATLNVAAPNVPAPPDETPASVQH